MNDAENSMPEKATRKERSMNSTSSLSFLKSAAVSAYEYLSIETIRQAAELISLRH